ncbi:putative acetyltransferase [bacterium BMS3Bbin10]|nr:putative acetyltransferase [bacterium BMS3Bbin10]
MARTIRPASAADAGAVRALVRDAYALYAPRMDREPAPMLADYEALIAQGAVSVFEAEGEIAGILVCYERGAHLHVENVAVATNSQGRGIGRELMAFAERQALARGLASVELYTNEVMGENLEFYEALGYEVVERAEEEGYSRIFFRKVLQAPDQVMS